ncbi:hypothetical protein CLE01_04730 [Cryobacterium levicorallinum]|nr:hypothetical protein CLE01_04730 [Cryobacterium levicorallinum]
MIGLPNSPADDPRCVTILAKVTGLVARFTAGSPPLLAFALTRRSSDATIVEPVTDVDTYYRNHRNDERAQ